MASALFVANLDHGGQVWYGMVWYGRRHDTKTVDTSPTKTLTREHSESGNLHQAKILLAEFVTGDETYGTPLLVAATANINFKGGGRVFHGQTYRLLV